MYLNIKIKTSSFRIIKPYVLRIYLMGFDNIKIILANTNISTFCNL